jgi:hypothetical protein
VHGLRRVDYVYGLDHAIPSEASSLAGRALVVVNLDRHPRKSFPFGGIAEVINDHPKVIENFASVIYLAVVASRIVLELEHISHNFKKYI